MKPPAVTAVDLEVALSAYFGYRRNVIVPNVSWGWCLKYEADLVVCRESRWAEEIEIKVAASDIVADAKKIHKHDDPRFRKLWFAVPEDLAGHPAIPARAGILAYVRRHHYYHDRPERVAWTETVIELRRRAAINPAARQVTDREYVKLCELGVMRVWSLKHDTLRRLNDRRAKEER